MGVKGSATVTRVRRGDFVMITWTYLSHVSNGKVEDVGSIEHIYGELQGVTFTGDGTATPDDNYDFIIIRTDAVGVESDIMATLAQNLPGAGNNAAKEVCPRKTATDGTTATSQKINFWDSTLEIQSGAAVGTSASIGNSKEGVIAMLLYDPLNGHWR